MPTLVDYRELLNERLKDPEIRKSFENETNKTNLQVMLNDLLQDTGNDKYCVEVMDIDEYYN
jgi:homospermidine synthase